MKKEGKEEEEEEEKEEEEEEKEEEKEEGIEEEGKIDLKISENEELEFFNINENKSLNFEENSNGLNSFNFDLNQNYKNNIINQSIKDKNTCTAPKIDEINIKKNNEIIKENKNGNIEDMIKNFIKKNFIKDFNIFSKKYILRNPAKKESKEKTENDNNNNKQNDLNFLESNFESFYNQCQKENKNKENIEESKEAKNLIKTTKLEYFNQLNENKKFSYFLEKDKKGQEKKYQKSKCRNKFYELFREKKIEEVILLLDHIYIDKKKYIKIKNCKIFQDCINDRGYYDFTIILSQNENDNILERKTKFENKAKELINYWNKEKEKKKE